MQASRLIERAEQTAAEQTPLVALSWQAQYAQARLVVDNLLCFGPQAAPPVSLLIAGGGLGVVKLRKDARSKLLARIRQIEREHLHGQRPAMDEPVIRQGFSEMLAMELQRLQQQLDQKAGQYHYFSLLVDKLAQQMSAQQTARRRRLALRNEIADLVATMQEWLEWVLDADPSGIVSAVHTGNSSSRNSSRSTLRLLERRTQITLENVLAGSVPWRRSVVGSDEATHVAAHKAWVKGLELQRISEELELIDREKAALLTTLDQQVTVLQRAIDSAEQPADHRYVFMQELLRVQQIQAAARQCFDRVAAGDAAAAADAMADIVDDQYEPDDDT